jgi:hypothetical protein
MFEDEKLPENLESEYNKILGVEGAGENKTSKHKVDEAYTESDNPYLQDTVDDDDEQKVTDTEDIEEVDEETGEDIEPSEDMVEAEAEETEEEVEIPDNWVMAGRSAGFSDEKIIKLFEQEPEVLDALANTREQLLLNPSPRGHKEDEIVTKGLLKPETIAHVNMEDDTMDMDESTRRVFKKLVENQNAVIDKLNEANSKLFNISDSSAQREAKEQDAFSRRIDNFFDKTNETNLGDSRALTPSQAHARKEVYGIAAMLANVNGESTEDNLDKALKAYHGIYSNPEKIAESKLRRQLDSQKKKFSPRPGGQKRVQKFKDEDSRVIAAMEQAARSMGLELG